MPRRECQNERKMSRMERIKRRQEEIRIYRENTEKGVTKGREDEQNVENKEKTRGTKNKEEINAEKGVTKRKGDEKEEKEMTELHESNKEEERKQDSSI